MISDHPYPTHIHIYRPYHAVYSIYSIYSVSHMYITITEGCGYEYPITDHCPFSCDAVIYTTYAAVCVWCGIIFQQRLLIYGLYLLLSDIGYHIGYTYICASPICAAAKSPLGSDSFRAAKQRARAEGRSVHREDRE